ncbi:ATP phosphoribosyltransferase regulatory subunit [Thermus sp. FJN-A]
MIPEGTRFLLPPEARLKAELVGRLRDLFLRHGYEPVELPALELYDPAHPLAERAFKLVDRTGEVLALRSEFTTLLARLLKGSLPEGVHRFQYAGALWLREADAELGRLREYTQVGLELIGATGPLADAEVLELAFAALEALGLGGVVEVGLPSLVGEVLRASGLPEGAQKEAQRAIHRKNLPELQALLARHPVPEEARKTLLALPDLYGEKEVLEEAKGLPLPPRAKEALRHLEKTLALLGRPVLLDLGMARRYEYYSGIFFRAYTPGFGLPLLGGGRYDGALLPQAAGFALGVERALEALKPPKKEASPEVLALDLEALRHFAGRMRAELFHGEDPVAYAKARGIPYLARGAHLWRAEEEP